MKYCIKAQADTQLWHIIDKVTKSEKLQPILLILLSFAPYTTVMTVVDSSDEVFCWASTNSPMMWQLIALQDALQQLTSHSEPRQLHAAPPIKTGDLSGPCVCPVGELWPRKYASNTFAVPIIESQPICLVMHMILKAQRGASGRYSSFNHQGSQQQHMSHDVVEFCHHCWW